MPPAGTGFPGAGEGSLCPWAGWALSLRRGCGVRGIRRAAGVGRSSGPGQHGARTQRQNFGFYLLWFLQLCSSLS